MRAETGEREVGVESREEFESFGGVCLAFYPILCRFVLLLLFSSFSSDF